MATIAAIAAKLFMCLLAADFLSGVAHWLEDSYGSETTPLVGEWIIKPNLRHHRTPRDIVEHTWFDSALVLLGIAAFLLCLFFLLGVLNWYTLTVVVIGVNANEVHKWAHRTPGENGALITFFQRTGLIQSTHEHAKHHSGHFDSHYCAVTNFLNPILELTRFWRVLEGIVCLATGAKVRKPDHLGQA